MWCISKRNFILNSDHWWHVESRISYQSLWNSNTHFLSLSFSLIPPLSPFLSLPPSPFLSPFTYSLFPPLSSFSYLLPALSLSLYWLHGITWLLLFSLHGHSLYLAGLLVCLLYLHAIIEWMFWKDDQYWCHQAYLWESHPYFSKIALKVLSWMTCKIGSRWQ